MEEESNSEGSHCFRCSEDAEYYCRECEDDFCSQCKEKHLIDLDFHTHDVVTTEMKYGNNTYDVACEKHPYNVYDLWCRRCMWSRKNDASMVARFDRSGRPMQSFQYNESGKPLYKKALFITENQNGDVIVSDFWYGVVVVNREGKYRFSYKGPPLGPRLSPHGVCTDVLMHILVCDYNTNSVHMIDKNGHFLRFILTNKHDMNEPRSLFYDNISHLLWVGSEDKYTNPSIYRYINRKNV
ncbi:uncharacterized protein LOC133176428 [Saccostrea echinata]|uniref:uncharacterized protein LOC133176428 n=1 Tax=Saccostrea echinata TaxID=191078 RepID=UPI002A7EC499|nr:uncharacterized protein LOC133176428 [Saccostrea echinata]